MPQTELSDLDFFMVCAVDIETNTYGTIRMAKEISTFEPTADGLREAQSTRGLLGQNGDSPVVEHYHFELLAPDFDDKDYAIWDMIADHQTQLRDIFELLSFEGVGFNPEPPELMLSQSMTWFYSSKPLSEYTDDPQFVEQAIDFLRNHKADSDFTDSQRVASLMTFAKHRCIHEWDGEPEFWQCLKCGKWSYLDDAPNN
jgi:hypothetical protein